MRIADYHGLQIVEFTGRDVETFRALNPEHGEIFDHLQTACAWLHKDDESGVICVNADMPVERKRLSIVHEGGHSLMPWHQGFDYLCGDGGIDSTTMSRIEREAFTCGSAFLMPPKHFITDVLSLDTSLASVRQLARWYVTSFEATAIWYASTHPGYCGFLLAEPNPVVLGKRSAAGPHQFNLRLDSPDPTVAADLHNQLSVKYFVPSSHLPLFIRPGTAIPEGNVIHRAWTSGRHVRGEMKVSALGSSASDRLRVDCEPWGSSGVVALLWLPDPRVGINFGPGVYA